MREGFDHKRIALIGVPSSAGARKAGQELAPRALRATGLREGLESAGIEVVDLGDLESVTFSPDTVNPGSQNLQPVLGVLRQVREAVDSAVAHRAKPLIIGGDCTITIGVLASLTKYFPAFGLIYVDGDVDMNTPATTMSGIFDGMVMAHVLGDGAPELSDFGPRRPLLEERDIALFGYSVEAGGIDPVEIELLRNTRMARYPLGDIMANVRDSAGRALRGLENVAQHILVHFDVDVIDFGEFPAADVPHRPGLSLEQAEQALRVFASSDKFAGLVISEFNAAMDSDGKLARRLSTLIRQAFEADDN